ncbi:hypothetical protein [Natrarchaeobaculum sulfurireducens]|uniref:DUF8159 domain-containing protein n=1 Tax=Natrarchaeobaculum sulfurireducens TaxID=2044521 RepID=A0A346PD78_9EURY|nr:hypothetical protein [Natrarchaeobaculum sulfurireducens]AXR77473.1 hypothetical protein AArc1_1132 [Natrarchaeobaculum sulfurireducens]
MKRRTLLTAAAGVVVAGCSTETPSAGPGEDETENRSASDEQGDTESDSGDDQPSDDAVLEAFETGLEDRGFEGVSVDETDDGVQLGYDATGTSDDDVATEIELITDGYTSAIELGLSSTSLDAIASDPDGDLLDYFTIETEWIEAYLADSLEWRELLTRIAQTFESEAPAEDADDPADDEEAESDGEDGDEDEDDEIDDGDDEDDEQSSG